MPGPASTSFENIQEETIVVNSAPVMNNFNNLRLLMKSQKVSGLSDWVYKTARRLDEDRKLKNTVAIDGLYYAIRPERNYSSFPEFIHSLEETDPQILRKKQLEGYATLPCCLIKNEELEELDFGHITDSFDNYLDFLANLFDSQYINIESEKISYDLLVNPPVMKEYLLDHLKYMWDFYLAEEWQRNQSLREEIKSALRKKDFSGMTKLEILHWIYGEENEKAVYWKELLEGNQQIILAPSTHSGPYHHHYFTGSKLWVLLGTQLPEGLTAATPEMGRAEILVRISAMNDDTRLKILKLIASVDELSSSEIMERLELSQSAASRHLKLLSASGYLMERRLHGAKHYSLNPKRIDETLKAASTFLLGK